jgi:exosortase/archaeosortase
MKTEYAITSWPSDIIKACDAIGSYLLYGGTIAAQIDYKPTGRNHETVPMG